ncbi:UNVERIFIED_CONTAM: hypothetical protein FKN15_056093 [Acipenser sinensis]
MDCGTEYDIIPPCTVFYVYNLANMEILPTEDTALLSMNVVALFLKNVRYHIDSANSGGICPGIPMQSSDQGPVPYSYQYYGIP